MFSFFLEKFASGIFFDQQIIESNSPVWAICDWLWRLITGHGAALNADGDVELDAIIMDGQTLASGAVSSVKNIANPVTLARAVMEKVLPQMFKRNRKTPLRFTEISY